MADLPKPPLDSARMRVRVPPPVEARVAEIRELMERGEWYTWTGDEFRRRWGLSAVRVREHAAEASRQLRSLSREEAAAKVQVLLEKAEYAARGSKTPSADLTRLAATWAKIYGLDRPAPAPNGGGGARELPAETWWGEGDGNEGEANGEK